MEQPAPRCLGTGCCKIWNLASGHSGCRVLQRISTFAKGPAMRIELPDPPLGTGVPVFGNAVSSTEFQGVLTHGLFKNLVPDPRRLEGPLAKYNPDYSEVANLRARVQRLINGAKRRNVDA